MLKKIRAGRDALPRVRVSELIFRSVIVSLASDARERVPPGVAFALAFLLTAPAFSQADHADAIRVRVVDEAGQPVSSAWLGMYARNEERYDTWMLSDLGEEEVYTDRDGRAAFTVPLPTDRTALLWAWQLDDKLVGHTDIGRSMYGKPEQEIVVYPGCTVSGGITSRDLELLGKKVTWTNVYVFKDGQRPLSFSSEEDARFEFVLPPGDYQLFAYGKDLLQKTTDIEVPDGVSELEIGVIDLPPTTLAKLIGKPAPEFREIKGWMNGEPTTLAALRDRYVLLDFWGYWCGPCIYGMPELMYIHDSLGDRGLTIIGVHDDSIESIEALRERLDDIKRDRWNGRDIPFLIALDGGGKQPLEGTDVTTRGATTAAYGITSFPTQVLIGPDGKVIEDFHAPSPDAAVARLSEMMGVDPKPSIKWSHGN